MKASTLFLLAGSAALATAHTTVFNVWINDVDQGLGNSASGYIRSPPNNNPLKDLTSSDLTCNVNNVATAKTLSVSGGDKITFEWHHDSNSASDDIIASSHKGPVIVYIAPTSSNGAGDVWVKLAEAGYDAATKTWAVDTLIANKGKHSITLPDLTAGTYLLRPEIIALHESDTAFTANSARGAQLYMECVQIEVTSSGTASLPAGVAIPGVYSYSDPGILFNLYSSFTSYTIPGPAVWDGVSSGTSPSVTTSKAATGASATSTPAVADSSAVAVIPSTEVAVVTPASEPSSTPVPEVPSAASTTAPIAVVTSPIAAVPTTFVTRTSSLASPAATGSVARYYQCGGLNYVGSTACEAGTTCKEWNPYYSQCVAA